MPGHVIDKDNTIKAFGKINSLLEQSLMKIKEINKDEQFDSCTNVKLAEEANKAELLTKEISGIVFKKEKEERSTELRELAEFACMLMDDPKYYCNEDQLLEEFFENKLKQELLNKEQER